MPGSRHGRLPQQAGPDQGTAGRPRTLRGLGPRAAPVAHAPITPRRKTPAPAIAPEAMEMLLQMGGAQVVADLLALFRSETPPLLQAMREALARHDGPRLQRIGPRPQGHGVQPRAPRRLPALCSELEKQGKSGSFEGVDEILARVEQQYEAVCSALEAGRVEARCPPWSRTRTERCRRSLPPPPPEPRTRRPARCSSWTTAASIATCSPSTSRASGIASPPRGMDARP